MPTSTLLEGDYEQHIANGGCHMPGHLHKNGLWFCQGMDGHFDFAAGEWHFTRLFSPMTGSETVRWLG